MIPRPSGARGRLRQQRSTDRRVRHARLQPALGDCKESGGFARGECLVETEHPAVAAAALGAMDREGGAEATAAGRMCRGRDDVLAHGNGGIWDLEHSMTQVETGPRELLDSRGICSSAGPPCDGSRHISARWCSSGQSFLVAVPWSGRQTRTTSIIPLRNFCGWSIFLLVLKTRKLYSRSRQRRHAQMCRRVPFPPSDPANDRGPVDIAPAASGSAHVWPRQGPGRCHAHGQPECHATGWARP